MSEVGPGSNSRGQRKKRRKKGQDKPASRNLGSKKFGMAGPASLNALPGAGKFIRSRKKSGPRATSLAERKVADREEQLKESYETIQQAGGDHLVVVPAGDSRVDQEKSSFAKMPQFEFPNDQYHQVIETVEQARKAVSEVRSLLESGSCDVPCTAFHMNEGGRRVQYLRVIGFDTERRPQFRAGKPQNRVALIQIYSPPKAFLFRVCKFPIKSVPELVLLLEDREVLKVGVGVSQDVDSLRQSLPNFDPHGSFVDIEQWLRPRFPNLRRLGLRNATASLLRMRLSKQCQKSNWELPNLTTGMLKYAACDSYVGFVLCNLALGNYPCELLSSCDVATSKLATTIADVRRTNTQSVSAKDAGQESPSLAHDMAGSSQVGDALGALHQQAPPAATSAALAAGPALPACFL